MQSEIAIYIHIHKYIFQCYIYIYTSPPLPFLPLLFCMFFFVFGAVSKVSMFDASAARKVDTLMLGLKTRANLVAMCLVRTKKHTTIQITESDNGIRNLNSMHFWVVYHPNHVLRI